MKRKPKKPVCDMDCLNCKFKDCINHGDMTLEERASSKEFETSLKKSLKPQVLPELGMRRYIHNRPDKEAYIKARNAEYDAKRKHDPKRLEQKKEYYQRHKEQKIAYQKKYYQQHKDELNAVAKLRYEANKDEINRKRREKRRAEKLKKEGEIDAHRDKE